MPTRIGSRPDGVLILEKVDGPLLAEALFEEHGFNATALAMSLGELVAHVHRLFDSGDTPGLGLDGRYIPSIFEHLFPITDTFLALTGAQIEILRTIQKFPELRRVVKELQTGWDGFAFIHGDLSLSNVLIRKATSEIVLLDWELAGLGDPRWDVGTVVAEWLGHWISSIPIVKGGTVNHLAQAATSLHQSVIIRIQEFWSAYAEAMQLQGITRQLWLTSAIQFAGVRLFQKAMEHGYQLPAMTGHEQLLMQLGMNLALKPSQAATSLFGTVVPGDA